MICPRCGNENTDSAKFCNECGIALVTAQTSGDLPTITDTPVKEDLDGYKDDQAKQSTAVLDLPPVFEGDDDTPDSELVDGFDFSAIKEDVSEDDETEQEVIEDSLDHDVNGFDEYLVEPGYSPPPRSWKKGDTMQMVPVEGEESAKQKDFRAPEDKEKRGKKKIVILVVLITLTLFALAAAGITYQMEMWGGKSLPDVVEDTVFEATETLESRGFVVKVMYVKSDDEKNKVLLMDPGAGRRLSEGSEVVLQVATPRIIPEIVGKSAEEAQTSLTTEGFERFEYTKVKSDSAENTVLSVSPEAGTEAQSSTLITVTIAEPYVVPEVLGMGIEGARNAITEAGFTPAEYYVYSEEPEYTVLGSNPGAGTKLASGSTVTISIAKSRSKELVSLTEKQLNNISILSAEGEGEYYAILSKGYPYYSGNGTTQAVVEVQLMISTSLGEISLGNSEERTLTFVWNNDNTLESYY